MSATFSFRRLKLWEQKGWTERNLILECSNIHICCIVVLKIHLLVSTAGCGMGKAYLWEANTKFNSSTVNLFISIFGTLIVSYPNEEIQKFLQVCYSKMHSLLLVKCVTLMNEVVKNLIHSEFVKHIHTLQMYSNF